jgi:3',5'-cyclic AMP phosphodiesterase CpdA
VKRLPPLVSLLSLSLAVIGVSGCLDVADGRAARDARIGQASAPGSSVHVHGGLATIRQLTPSVLSLWAQAPDVTLDLTTEPGAPAIEVIAANVLVDAALIAPTPSNGVVVEPLAGTIPNERRWRVTPPAAGGSWALRITPPDVDAAGPWRFAVFADVQEAIDRVQDIYRRMAEDPRIRFVLMSGDLTQRGTPEQLARFQSEMQGLPLPIYATLGNHELGSGDYLFGDYFGRGNFSFVFRNVQFTLLDTASATLAPIVYEWLGGWLLEGIDRVHFVFAHIPPLDPTGTRNGAFASRLEANKLVSLLASGRVDTTFYGHIHSFYAYSNGGIPAYITGGGGAIPEQLDGIARHYLTVDVDPERQTTQVAIVRVD